VADKLATDPGPAAQSFESKLKLPRIMDRWRSLPRVQVDLNGRVDQVIGVEFDVLGIAKLGIFVFPMPPARFPPDQPVLASMLACILPIDIIPRTVVRDFLGIVGMLVITVLFRRRHVDEIGLRDADFDSRVHQVAWVDRNGPDI
jgi:hypothetical protein